MTEQHDSTQAATGTQCQILLADEGDALTIEIRSNNVAHLASPANLMCAFIAKYWTVLCDSMQMELKQAAAEISNKAVEPAGLNLVSADGKRFLNEQLPLPFEK